MFHVKLEQFQELTSTDLSPEVEARLKTFADLLARWNTRINLISPADLKTRLWSRHIADSLQLIPFLPSGLSTALDLGAGAGFPGLVLAIATGVPFSLIESDRRKAAFLVEIARLTTAPVRVYPSRIEETRLPPTRLVTARALAPLPELLTLAEPLLAPDGVCLFPKGKNWPNELTDAAARWHMRVERFPSRTDSEASILRISEIRRVRASP
jgi:16S rRNA (guanine527-N7)-methyltransferase